MAAHTRQRLAEFDPEKLTSVPEVAPETPTQSDLFGG